VLATRRSRRPVFAAVAGIVLLIGAGVGYQAWRSRATPVQPTASVMPAATVAAAPTTALEFTQLGLGLLRRYDRQDNIDKATASFESAITLDKTFAPAWAGLARAFWRQRIETGDAAWTPRAVDAATQATALDPYLADAHVSLGLAKLSAGDIPASRRALELALTLDPANAGAHRGLGDIEDAADRKAQAAQEYERALAGDTTDWDLMSLRGAVSYDRAEYAEALVWYKRAADAAPDSAIPYQLMGGAHHMLGDLASAGAAFQRSISIQPTDSAYTNLGTALFFQGRYRESVQAFERAVELAPSRAILWGNLADAYRWVPGNTARSQEAYGRAIQRLREALAKDSGNVLNRSRLALYLAKAGDTTAGLAELAKVPTVTATEVNTLFRATVTYELAGDRANALAMLERALDRGYGLTEVRMDPELAALRKDVRYHRLIARFESETPPTP
jgi:eukaryotic-like serine/threonine-protein kinase